VTVPATAGPVGARALGETPASYTLDDRLHRPRWQADGACVGRLDITWFPERGDDGEAAKGICAGRPVRDQCLAFALADRSLDGIWAGTTSPERRAMRRLDRAS
jgi:hypothetical protein